ncbi:MAG: TIGR02757 family protein [Bacteroidota bacterium]
MIPKQIIELLDEKVAQYNQPLFIETDPVFVPHQYNRKEDIEIAGFLSATIAWGSRVSIIKNALRIMQLMDHAPFEFIMNHTAEDLRVFDGYVHRTFNSEDLKYFCKALHHIYHQKGGMENIFAKGLHSQSTQPAIHYFKKVFFSLPDAPVRTKKHISDPVKGSAAKRINMFLRWMVRNDQKGVDFGIWKSIKPAQLSCPLDVHSGNVARKLGLITRKQNDAAAVNQLDAKLRFLDPADPVKYDYALFGLGVFEKY